MPSRPSWASSVACAVRVPPSPLGLRRARAATAHLGSHPLATRRRRRNARGLLSTKACQDAPLLRRLRVGHQCHTIHERRQHGGHRILPLEERKAHHPNLLHRILHKCAPYASAVSCPFARRCASSTPAPKNANPCKTARWRDDVEQIVKLCTPGRPTTSERGSQHPLRSTRSPSASATPFVARLPACVSSWRAHDAEALNASLADLHRRMEDTDKRLEYVRAQIDRLSSLDADLCSIHQEDRCGVILPCGHTFCRPCISQHAQRNSSCPPVVATCASTTCAESAWEPR